MSELDGPVVSEVSMVSALRQEFDGPRHRTVVLGAGFAGLRCATALARDPRFEVILVDRDRDRLDKTRLHEADGQARSLDLQRLLERTPVVFVQAEVLAVERREKTVTTDTASIPYDTLVFALGGGPNDHGIRGVREHALSFTSTRDSTRFAQTMANLQRTSERLVVVGGGPTGVEAAAEAARYLKPGRVVLLDRSETLLPSYPSAPSAYASFMLRRMGVRIRPRSKVVEVREDGAVLAGGENVAAGAVLWCAGGAASPLLREAGLSSSDQPAEVDTSLISAIDENVYVIGDSASQASGVGARPSAQIAVQQGDFVAEDLQRKASSLESEPFTGTLLGEFTSIGPLDAVGALRFGSFQLPLVGPAAWLLKEVGGLRHSFVIESRRLGLAFLKGRLQVREAEALAAAAVVDEVSIPVAAT